MKPLPLNPAARSSSIGGVWLRFAAVTLCGAISALARGDRSLPVEVFDPEFLVGDSAYHAVTEAADGRVYYSIGTHQTHHSTRLFRFDPESKMTEQVADLSAVAGIDPEQEVPHGKVHTPLIEHEGALYFATHTSTYVDTLPDVRPADGRSPYRGGQFMRVVLASGDVEVVASSDLPNEGLITMAVDPRNDMLYGLTWPSGIVLGYDLNSGELHNWGAVQGRGEWGQLGDDWDFICRSLGVDPDGTVYGSTNTGRIWKLDHRAARPLAHYQQLDLDAVPAVQSESFTITDEVHFFWRNWRTITWNPSTESFWGLHGGSSQLFEFAPEQGTLRSVARMLPTGVEVGRRNPWRTQLGFAVAPDNTLYYLAHGPPQDVPGRAPVRASVHLLTYQIESGRLIDHGILTSADGRRVFFTESLEIGAAGDLYTVAWVETIDPIRQAEIQAARGAVAPDETTDIIYEMQLVRLGADSAGMAQVRDRLAQD